MSNKITYVIHFFCLLYACKNNRQQQSGFDFQPPEVVEAKGYIVPQDKITPPEITPAKEIKSKAISKPNVIKWVRIKQDSRLI